MSSLKISFIRQQYIKIITRCFNRMHMLIIVLAIMSFISAKTQTILTESTSEVVKRMLSDKTLLINVL